MNNSGFRLYNLIQYDYLISIIAKLEKYTYVLQDMVFLSIRKYFVETDHNLANLEKIACWLDNNIENHSFTKWDWLDLSIKINNETTKELDFKNTFKNCLPFYNQKQDLCSLKSLAFNHISSTFDVIYIF